MVAKLKWKDSLNYFFNLLFLSYISKNIPNISIYNIRWNINTNVYQLSGAQQTLTESASSAERAALESIAAALFLKCCVGCSGMSAMIYEY